MIKVVIHAVLHPCAVNFDGQVRAGKSAKHAPDATARVVHFSVKISLDIDVLGHPDNALRTGRVAKLTALAQVLIYSDAWHSIVSLAHAKPKRVRPRVTYLTNLNRSRPEPRRHHPPSHA